MPEAKWENPNATYQQDQEANEYRYLSPAWLDAMAEGLTKGAVKHPGETWRTIPADEHLARAMRHINLYRKGDRSDPHIVNASMRLMMAFEVSRNEQTDREATGVALIQNPEYERLEKQYNELLRERTLLQLKIMNLEKNTVYQEKEADDEQ